MAKRGWMLTYLLDVEIDGRQHRYEDRRLYIYQTRKLETRK